MLIRKAYLSDFDWRVLPPGTERITFDAPSGPIATACWGRPDGIPALLVPGITGSKEDFSLVGPLLGAQGYRVWSIDLAGQYQSHLAGPDQNGHWTPALHLRDIESILNYLGPAHLVGYSFSGVLAQTLIVKRPDLLRSVTLLSTPPTSGDGFSLMKVIGPLAWAVPSSVGSAGLLLGLKFNINRVDPNRALFVRRRLHSTVPASVHDAIEAMRHIPNLDFQLRSSGIPLLVAAGSGDLWSLRHHRAFAKRIGAQMKRYRAGHAPSETTPDEFSADLLEFFEGVESDKSTAQAS